MCYYSFIRIFLSIDLLWWFWWKEQYITVFGLSNQHQNFGGKLAKEEKIFPLFFVRLFRGGELEAHKIKQVYFCSRFAGGNKNIIQKKRENLFRRKQKLHIITYVYSKSQKGRDPNSMIKFLNLVGFTKFCSVFFATIYNFKIIILIRPSSFQ